MMSHNMVKINLWTCVSREVSDQFVCPCSLIREFAGHSVDSQGSQVPSDKYSLHTVQN